MTEPGVTARDFTTEWDQYTLFPFVEDENANITGYGHQGRDAFAAAVNRYDEVCTGERCPEHVRWGADAVGHAWVTIDKDGERLHPCRSDTPGAVPVTTLWGQR